jgi:hypothetical protein
MQLYNNHPMKQNFLLGQVSTMTMQSCSKQDILLQVDKICRQHGLLGSATTLER